MDHIKRTGNPTVDGGGQPFRVNQLVIIEKRTTEGNLDFSGEQPPTRSMTFDELYQLFFRSDLSSEGSWEALRGWLDSKGWVVRAKTW